MLENIADARVETVFFAYREGMVGAGDRFGVATETRQCWNTRRACPDDRKQVPSLEGDCHALLGDQ